MASGPEPCRGCGQSFCTQPTELCERQTMHNEMARLRARVAELEATTPQDAIDDMQGRVDAAMRRAEVAEKERDEARTAVVVATAKPATALANVPTTTPTLSRGEMINRRAFLGSQIVSMRERIPLLEKTAKKAPPKTLTSEWDKVRAAKQQLETSRQQLAEMEREHAELSRVWLYNVQWGVEMEYIEMPPHEWYPHSRLAWTGRTRTVYHMGVTLGG